MIFAHFLASVEPGSVPVSVLAILMALLFVSICLVYAAVKVFKRSWVAAVLLGLLALLPWMFIVVRVTLFLIYSDQ